MLWSEIHRPQSFDEVVGNDEIVSEIENEVKSGNMNHMAFFGPPGVGKTTIAYIIADELYGSNRNTHFMELNASDERGINTIRNKVKKFASRNTVTDIHKVIFLDEADSLTRDAQDALRRIMEKQQERCRFILTGNDEGGLIEAIKSRCSEHRFRPIDDGSAKTRLREIADTEGLDIDDETIEKIVTIYSGDLRSMVNKLQGAHSSEGDISLDAGEDYKKLLKYIKSGNFMAAKRIATDQNVIQMYRYILSNDKAPNEMKADISIVIAKYQFRMDRSPDRDIQKNAMVAELIETIGNYT